MNKKIVLLLLCLVCLFICSINVGSFRVSLLDIPHLLQDKTDNRGIIVWDIRIPRTLLAILVGGNLGVAGAILQSLFHNPLAEPHVIGLSSGALLGATLYFLLAGSTWDIDPIFTPWVSMLGAFLVLAILILFNKKFSSSTTIILLGVSINSLLSSVVALLLFLKQKTFQGIYFWLMGGFNGKGWTHFTILFIYSLIGIPWALLWRRKFNLLFLSEEEIYSLGLPLKKYQPIILILLSFLIAPSVAVSGAIGFIGLIAPHMMRVWETPDYSWLIPSSFLSGAILLLSSDILARMLFYPTEIPVGIITSFFGVPFFIYLLVKKK
ncbi:MAG TPA: iron ABC transporter permease [Dictyoglomaceae bacterium]|nr:iron ABC transporter permease [Dictyoglomaceae bacterium]HOP94311.1 iron ABC transporter permease [Dictyoglomaceae bacterium]HPP15233.1 iron ABC transporter permease [Dictyoglomaceae bacterium]HPU42640.1 iron ABC transporter permease [Dictyoglomaceae bacterium]